LDIVVLVSLDIVTTLITHKQGLGRFAKNFTQKSNYYNTDSSQNHHCSRLHEKRKDSDVVELFPCNIITQSNLRYVRQ